MAPDEPDRPDEPQRVQLTDLAVLLGIGLVVAATLGIAIIATDSSGSGQSGSGTGAPSASDDGSGDNAGDDEAPASADDLLAARNAMRAALFTRDEAEEPIPFDAARAILVGDFVTESLTPSIEQALSILEGFEVPTRLVSSWTPSGFAIGVDVASTPPEGVDLGEPGDPGVYADWASELARWIREDDADVVMIATGYADTAARAVNDVDIGPGSPEWARWFDARVRALNTLVTASGTAVVWIEPACVADPAQSLRLTAIRDIVRSRAEATELVVSIPLDDHACPFGSFESTVVDPETADSVALRSDDGVAFDEFEAPEYIADWLANQLAAPLTFVTRRG